MSEVHVPRMFCLLESCLPNIAVKSTGDGYNRDITIESLPRCHFVFIYNIYQTLNGGHQAGMVSLLIKFSIYSKSGG